MPEILVLNGWKKGLASAEHKDVSALTPPSRRRTSLIFSSRSCVLNAFLSVL